MKPTRRIQVARQTEIANSMWIGQNCRLDSWLKVAESQPEALITVTMTYSESDQLDHSDPAGPWVVSVLQQQQVRLRSATYDANANYIGNQLNSKQLKIRQLNSELNIKN